MRLCRVPAGSQDLPPSAAHARSGQPHARTDCMRHVASVAAHSPSSTLWCSRPLARFSCHHCANGQADHPPPRATVWLRPTVCTASLSFAASACGSGRYTPSSDSASRAALVCGRGEVSMTMQRTPATRSAAALSNASLRACSRPFAPLPSWTMRASCGHCRSMTCRWAEARRRCCARCKRC